MRTKFAIAGLGGTFDRLHDGHKGFLKFAAEMADYLIIGVADERLSLHKGFAEMIEPRYVRTRGVKRFCNDNHIAHEIVELNDPYGPTIDPETRIETLIVTEETAKGADKINEIRGSMGLAPLPVHIYSMQKDERGQTISSSNIRAGEISRSGIYFAGLIDSGLKINEDQREFFSRLQGKLIKEPTLASNRICIVGDSALENFLSHHWEYDLAIFDKRTKRGNFTSPYIEKLTVDQTTSNQPGEISAELTALLKSWKPGAFKNLLIDGEEDLATVALALTLPLESVIYYGQPKQGLVELVVTEKVKNKFYQALVQIETQAAAV